MYKFFVDAGLVLFSAVCTKLFALLTLSFSIVLCLLALYHPDLYSFFYLMSLLSIYVAGITYLLRTGLVI